MDQNPLENKPKTIFKTLNASNFDSIPAIAALEKRVFGDKVDDPERLKQKLLKGEVMYTIWSGDQVIGMATALAKSDPDSRNRIKKELPVEFVFAGGAAVDPEFRGESLQATLLEKRKELAGQLGKETLLGTVRPENGASLRNIIKSGGRILAYSPDFFIGSKVPARLVWENDLTIKNEPDEKDDGEDKLFLEKDFLFPDIVVSIKSGEQIDTEAQKEIGKVLSGDYVGIRVETSQKDGAGVPLDSVIVFRHLSNFLPKKEERLRERKKKIQDILKPEQEKLTLIRQIEISPAVQKMRRQVERLAYQSDHGLEKYKEVLGISIAEMEGKMVLDIGSGPSQIFSTEATRAGLKVVSLAPFLEDNIARLDDGTVDPVFSEARTMISVAGRGQEMPFKDDTFDYELALFSVPYYLPYDTEEYTVFFKEVIRTLRSGGKAFFAPLFKNKMKLGPMISQDFIFGVLDKFSDFITYKVEKLDKEDKECRLVLTKK